MQPFSELQLWKLFSLNMFPNKGITRHLSEMCNDAKLLYQSACKAVQPKLLIHSTVEIKGDNLLIQNKSYPLSKNAYIVGFGKAVLGMAQVLEYKLKEHLVAGILSIPSGMLLPEYDNTGRTRSRLQVYEGAHNNSPDQNSFEAAMKIKELVNTLQEKDLLLVLISGGGSALLPAPKPPLTLEDKRKVISLLTSKGATIEELNSVRKRLSLLKGGKLAQLAKPATVISLILSDIIGDPLSMIASGPTVPNTDDHNLPKIILEKYDIVKTVPNTVNHILQEAYETVKLDCFSHVSNFIIGNNTVALKAAAQTALEMEYQPIIMTRELIGTAKCVGRLLIQLVIAGLKQDILLFDGLYNTLRLEPEKKQVLIASLRGQERNICLLFGGETTVQVHGKGIGGRNQELALGAALELESYKIEHNIVLISAGTDGIDGPTTAAGAIVTKSTVEEAIRKNLNPHEYLHNNDSYNFFTQLNYQLLLKPGHTGTNVMDFIAILINLF